MKVFLRAINLSRQNYHFQSLFHLNKTTNSYIHPSSQYLISTQLHYFSSSEPNDNNTKAIKMKRLLQQIKYQDDPEVTKDINDKIKYVQNKHAEDKRMRP